MTTPSIHRQLRDATDDLHGRVDRQASGFDLKTKAGYRAFLVMMERGLSAVEPALDCSGAAGFYPQWPGRKRLPLARSELGHDGERQADPALHLASEAEAWGALYVLEGSRLGSRMLAREAPQSGFLKSSAKDRSWPIFLEALTAADDRLDDAPAMIRGAQKAFAAFLC